jgi:hypothetical protein
MVRAPRSSILHSAPHPQSHLNRQLRRWLAKELRTLQPILVASAARCQAERYRKHFNSFAHACLLIFHGLTGSPSLRQSYAGFAACRGLASLAGLAVCSPPDDEQLAVSFSQFANSNQSRPAAFLAGVIPSLGKRVRHSRQTPSFPLPVDLHILDSTFLRLSLKLSPWLGQL